MRSTLKECKACTKTDDGWKTRVLSIIDPHACDHSHLTTESGDSLITCQCRCHQLWDLVQAEKEYRDPEAPFDGIALP